jgi:hypothetical protein
MPIACSFAPFSPADFLPDLIMDDGDAVSRHRREPLLQGILAAERAGIEHEGER